MLTSGTHSWYVCIMFVARTHTIFWKGRQFSFGGLFPLNRTSSQYIIYYGYPITIPYMIYSCFPWKSVLHSHCHTDAPLLALKPFFHALLVKPFVPFCQVLCQSRFLQEGCQMAYVSALPSFISVSLYIIPALPSPPPVLTNYLL